MNCPLKAMTVLPLSNVVSVLVRGRGGGCVLVVNAVAGEIQRRLISIVLWTSQTLLDTK